MRFQTHRNRKTPFINIISLVDILCILLIFFIVTTVFKKEEPIVQIKLPETTQAEAAKETPPTIIYVTADEKIFLDSQPVSPDQLGSILKTKMDSGAFNKLAMKADKKAPFGLIVKVMDAAKFAGIKNLPTFTEDAKPSGTP
ncbi:MAG: biopolymer transporter ExbD [Verrucomicrobia bacterium Tous-C9LFEB]|nr:MAG: biopolymer transporter ExbD [Verrucomicrobia bacterium Tous-C9LFEB]